jgi:four helix bundle protein
LLGPIIQYLESYCSIFDTSHKKQLDYIHITIMTTKYDLEERLINFSVRVIDIVTIIPFSTTGKHLANQLARSGTSVSLNYGEAQSAESNKDFIHKMKMVLKELRETFICLKIIHRAGLCKSSEQINNAMVENNELISIFVKSVQTAQKRLS